MAKAKKEREKKAPPEATIWSHPVSKVSALVFGGLRHNPIRGSVKVDGKTIQFRDHNEPDFIFVTDVEHLEGVMVHAPLGAEKA